MAANPFIQMMVLAGAIPPAPTVIIVACVICGGVCKPDREDLGEDLPRWMALTLVRAQEEYLQWRKKTYSKRQYSQEGDALIKEIDNVEFVGGPDGIAEKTNGLIPQQYPIDTKDEPLMNIPVHSNCLAIAKKFCHFQQDFDIEFRSAEDGTATSIAHLYEMWNKRAIFTCPVRGVMTTPIPGLNEYYGLPRFVHHEEYLAYRDPKPLALWRRWEADPLRIPNLTETIMSRLVPMDPKTTDVPDHLDELLWRVECLPAELFNRIYDHMHPLQAGNHAISLRCSRVRPSKWWRDALLSGKLIPWLFDLNLKDIQLYRYNKIRLESPDTDLGVMNINRMMRDEVDVFNEDGWDWELLCRQLAQPDLFLKKSVWRKAGILSTGLASRMRPLWNRYRIWKLLDESRLGHVIF